MDTPVNKLRVGVVGLGFMGRTHFSRLVQHPSAIVTAVCDEDADKRAGRWRDTVGNLAAREQESASLEGVAQFAALPEMLANPDLDAVVIALPSDLHADAAVAALEAGKHVFCEKPMALTVPDCDRMLAAERSSGRALMIGHCIRFWPQYELVKRAVDEGRIGRVQYANLRRVSSPPTFGTGNWFMNVARSGGALLDLHVHDIDFARHLLGLPAAIQAVGRSGPSGGIDHVLASWTFADGCYAAIEGGWGVHPPCPFSMSIVVHGETGTLAWDSREGAEVRLYQGDAEPELLTPEVGDGWSRELDYFVQQVLAASVLTRCPASESREAVALARVELEAITKASPITIDKNTLTYQ